MNRDELIQLATEKKIKYRKKFLKEANDETIEKICAEYKAQQLDEVNEQLVEILIEKFSNLLEQLELISSKNNLENNLSKNEPFKKDVKKIVSFVTPYFIDSFRWNHDRRTRREQKSIFGGTERRIKKNSTLARVSSFVLFLYRGKRIATPGNFVFKKSFCTTFG